MRWMLLTVLLLACGGCAGMDSDECRTADWRAIGYEDGIQGKSGAYFGTRRKACAEHGIAADFDAYLAGRAQGLTHFCRPRNGYRLGTQGQPYSGVCPDGLDQAFVDAHAAGYGLYERSANLNRIAKRLRHTRQRATEIEYRLTENTALLISPELDPTQRAALALELKQLAEDKIDVERLIDQLEDEYASAELDYEHYRMQIADRRGV